MRRQMVSSDSILKKRCADLADVIRDPAVVRDVQGVLHCVVVTLRELEGLFVTQLQTQRTRMFLFTYILNFYYFTFVV